MVIPATAENTSSAQLMEQLIGFDESNFGLPSAIDLAVDAIEVANLVRVQIDANGNAGAAAADDGIDESVRFEPAVMTRVQRVARGRARVS